MRGSFLLLVILILSSQGLAQQDEKVLHKTIYIQWGSWFKPYLVYNGQVLPAGRNYENLMPIMQKYPEARKELRNGMKLLKSSDKYACILEILLLSTQIVLEQLLQFDKDEYVGVVGVGLYGGMIGSFMISYKRLKEGRNAIEKAIWLYNNAVNEQFYSSNVTQE